jgi:hypothetical protein
MAGEAKRAGGSDLHLIRCSQQRRAGPRFSASIRYQRMFWQATWIVFNLRFNRFALSGANKGWVRVIPAARHRRSDAARFGGRPPAPSRAVNAVAGMPSSPIIRSISARMASTL